MKRAVIFAAVVAAGILVFAAISATAGGSGSAAGNTIHVVEHADTDAITNGTAGDDAGNVLTFANDVFDKADANRDGTVTTGERKALRQSMRAQRQQG